MNKAYRLIWSRVKEAWVVVSEKVAGKGGPRAATVEKTAHRRGHRGTLRSSHASALQLPPLAFVLSLRTSAYSAVKIGACLLLAAGSAFALPTGSQIVSGTAGIVTSGSTMTVTNSAGAIINWQGFSIANGETTRFIQPSALSAVLNRVTGGDPSKILGTLQSNGKVLLINPSGIIFGAGSRVDVNGLIASSLDIANQDFLAGKMKFTAGAMAGKVENQGTITTPSGGSVYLIASDVQNSGVITAPNGDVLLAAGKEVLLVDSSNPEIAMVVTAPEGQSINLGTIVANAGRVGMYGSVVRQQGRISADSAVSEGGKIFLRATKSIELADTSVTSADGTKGGTIIAKTEENGEISGTLTARGMLSAQGDGSCGSGGFIETSAAKLDLNGVKVKTNGGMWLLDPFDFTIASSGGDITGAALGTLLNNNSVTIQTTTGTNTATNLYGTTVGNGDIFVNDSVTWTTPNKLSLIADGGIAIKADILGTDTGSTLSLTAATSVTQPSGFIIVGNLALKGTANYTLGYVTNNIKTVASNTTGSVNIINNGAALAVGTADGVVGITGGTAVTLAGGKISVTGALSSTGSISLTGTGAPTEDGIIVNAPITTASGNITLNGTGGDGNSTYAGGRGVVVNSPISTTSGNISITGIGGDGAGTSYGNAGSGVVITGGTISTNATVGTMSSGNVGTITITGTGGNGAAADFIDDNGGFGGNGVEITGSSLTTTNTINGIVSGGTLGIIKIKGTGGLGGDGGIAGAGGSGVIINGSNIVSNTWPGGAISGGAVGNISIEGDGGVGGAGRGDADMGQNPSSGGTGGDGIVVTSFSGDSTISAAGDISLTGIGGNGGAATPTLKANAIGGNAGYGIYLESVNSNTTQINATSTSGLVIMDGIGGAGGEATGGPSAGTAGNAIGGDGNVGIYIDSVAVASSAGAVSLTGIGGAGGMATGGAGTNNMSFYGDSGSADGGSGADGIFLKNISSITTESGNIDLDGTGGVGGSASGGIGVGNYAGYGTAHFAGSGIIIENSTLKSNAGGVITLTGTGGAGGVGTGGTATLEGGYAEGGNGGGGIYFINSSIIETSGNISLDGTASNGGAATGGDGTNIGGYALGGYAGTGVRLSTVGSSITSTAGNITITGKGGYGGEATGGSGDTLGTSGGFWDVNAEGGRGENGIYADNLTITSNIGTLTMAGTAGHGGNATVGTGTTTSADAKGGDAGDTGVGVDKATFSASNGIIVTGIGNYGGSATGENATGGYGSNGIWLSGAYIHTGVAGVGNITLNGTAGNGGAADVGLGSGTATNGTGGSGLTTDSTAAIEANSTTGTVTLNSANDVNIAGTVSSKGFELLGAGNYVLSASNQVGTIAGNLSGNLIFNNSGNLVVGSGSTGITSSANISLTSNGTITQTNAISGNLLTTNSVGGTVLSLANSVTSFNATNSGTGNIELTNSAALLTINGVKQSAAGAVIGDVIISNSGATSDVSIAGLVATSFYSIDSVSVKNAGNVSITAGRDITLAQGSVLPRLDPYPAAPTPSAYAIIDTSVVTNGNGTNAGKSGNITLTAGHSITGALGNLDATVSKFQYSTSTTPAPAGNITLTAGGDVTVGSLSVYTGQNDTGGYVGNAGNITVTALGSVAVGAVNAEVHGPINNYYTSTVLGNGGNINITAGGSLTLNAPVDARVSQQFATTVGIGGDLTLKSTGGALTLGDHISGNNIFLQHGATTAFEMISGNITAVGNLQFRSAGAVTDSSDMGITAQGLELLGTGSFDLTYHAANSFTKLAGDTTGSISVVNGTGNLAIDTVNTTTKLSSSNGSISVTQNGGTLTVAKNLSATSAGSTIALQSTNGVGTGHLTVGGVSLSAGGNISLGTTFQGENIIINGAAMTSAAGSILLQPATTGSITLSGGSFTSSGALTTTANTSVTGYVTLGINSIWNNGGTLDISSGGYIILNTGSQLNNQFGGFITLTGASGSPVQGAGLLNNVGTLNKTTTTAQSISSAFSNSGTVNVSSSTLNLNGTDTQAGVLNVASGATLALSGTQTLNSGVDFTGTGNVTFGGTINLATPLTFGGSDPALSLASATINGSATNIFTTTASTAATGYVTLGTSSVWDNSGTLDINSGGYIILNTGSQLNNQFGGFITLTGASGSPVQGVGTLNNVGTLNKTTTTAQSISSVFNNSGTINVSSSTLILNGTDTQAGVLDVANGATLALSGTQTLNSGVDFTGTGNVSFGGTINLATPLTFGGSDPALSLTSATINGSATNIFTTTASTAATGYVTLGTSSVWDNSGTLDINSGGYIFLNTGSQLNNQFGGFITLTGASGSPVQGVGTLNNVGTLNKTTTTAQSISSAFSNSGTLNVDTGILAISSTFTQSGTLNVASGATLSRTTGFTNTGTISGNGTITVGTGTSKLINRGNINPGGAGAAGTLSFAGDLQLDTGSNLNIELGGTIVGQSDKLTIAGNITSSGILNASLIGGYTPASADAIAFMTMGGTASGSFATTNLPAGFVAGYNLGGGEAARLIYATGSNVFTNAATGLTWETPGNWSYGVVPNGTQTAVLSTGTSGSPMTVTHGSGVDTIGALTINNYNSLSIIGGSLAVTGATTLNGSLSVSGSTASTILNGPLNGTGNLSIGAGGGSLVLNGATTVANYSQAGGTLSGSGSLAVTNSFSGSGGSINSLFTSLGITQVTGSLNIGVPITASGVIVLNAPDGSITQSGPIVAAFLNTYSATGTLLTNSTNQVARFSAVNSSSGDIILTNSAAPLTIAAITQSGTGNVVINNTGITITGSELIASGGSVSMNANSQLAIGSGGITAVGNISLFAATSGGADNLTVGGSIVSTTGKVDLEGGNVTQLAGSTVSGKQIELRAITPTIGTLTLGGAINAAESVDLVADNLMLSSPTVTVSNSSIQNEIGIHTISSGRAITVGDVGVGLNVTDTSDTTFSAPTLVIGSDTLSGGTAPGPITVVAPVTRSQRLALVTDSSVTQNSGASITANELGIIAGGAVTFGDAGNAVANLVVETVAGDVAFTSSTPFSVVEVVGGIQNPRTISGVSTQVGNVSLITTGGNLTLSSPVSTGSGVVTLVASGSILDPAGFRVVGSTMSATAGSDIGIKVAPLITQVSQWTDLMAGGSIYVDNYGGVSTGSSTVTASSGNVALTAHSPLTIGSGGITAVGDITLVAAASDGTDNLTVNGSVLSTSGNIILKAGEKVVIGTNGSATAASGSVTTDDKSGTSVVGGTPPPVDSGALISAIDTATMLTPVTPAGLQLIALAPQSGGTVGSGTDNGAEEDKDKDKDKKKGQEQQPAGGDKKDDKPKKKFCN